MTEEQLREILERATRLREDRYLHWENAGGRIECEHGYAAGVACPRCDQRGARTDVPALVAAYRELRVLAAELATALDRCLVSMTDAIEPMDVAGQLGAESLDRAREHGLCEAGQ